MISKVNRALAVTAFTLTFLAAPAGPVFADPAVPTDYQSRVTAVEPATDDLTVEVAGGDAFLEVVVVPGHAVEIPGYEGEPYIRIDEHGVVTVNDRSPSKFLNDDRFGKTVPDSADAMGSPLWQVVGTDGKYAWHDHRTHWMSPTRPPAIVGNTVQQVFRWEIPITVDGVEHLLEGTLEWHPSGSGITPLAIGLMAIVALAGWRRGKIRYLAISGALAAAIGLILSFAQWLATPAAARTFPTSTVAPAFAFALLVVAAALADSRRLSAVQAIVVACVALGVFVAGSFGVLTKPVLPSAITDPVERIATAAVGWVTVAIGAIAVVEMLRLNEIFAERAGGVRPRGPLDTPRGGGATPS